MNISIIRGLKDLQGKLTSLCVENISGIAVPACILFITLVGIIISNSSLLK